MAALRPAGTRNVALVACLRPRIDCSGSNFAPLMRGTACFRERQLCAAAVFLGAFSVMHHFPVRLRIRC